MAIQKPSAPSFCGVSRHHHDVSHGVHTFHSDGASASHQEPLSPQRPDGSRCVQNRPGNKTRRRTRRVDESWRGPQNSKTATRIWTVCLGAVEGGTPLVKPEPIDDVPRECCHGSVGGWNLYREAEGE